jgi:N-acetylglucosaminyldiphosphoundecaprenol N-acetyl-beta-D-mannosaminyltransferase
MAADSFVDDSEPSRREGSLGLLAQQHSDVLELVGNPGPLPCTTMFGLAFSVLTLQDTLAELAQRAVARHGTLVMTCNVDHVVLRRQIPAFAEAYDAAHIVTADGAPLVAFSRLLRPRVPERVTGADLVAALPSIAGPYRLRVALVGGAQGVAAQAAERLAQSAPGMPEPLAITPPMGLEIGSADDADLVSRLQEFDPHIVVVCFGAPRQELWMHHHLGDLPNAILLGGGASLDFVVGLQRRAPRWVQKAGFEWVWRLSHDFPRLARRYLVQDAQIFPMVLGELMARARQRLRRTPRIQEDS